MAQEVELGDVRVQLLQTEPVWGGSSPLAVVDVLPWNEVTIMNPGWEWDVQVHCCL